MSMKDIVKDSFLRQSGAGAKPCRSFILLYFTIQVNNNLSTVGSKIPGASDLKD